MGAQTLGIFYENSLVWKEGVGENIPNTGRVIVSARRLNDVILLLDI